MAHWEHWQASSCTIVDTTETSNPVFKMVFQEKTELKLLRYYSTLSLKPWDKTLTTGEERQKFTWNNLGEMHFFIYMVG